MRIIIRRHLWSKWELTSVRNKAEADAAARASGFKACATDEEANMRCLRLNRARTQIIFGSLAGLVLVVAVGVTV